LGLGLGLECIQYLHFRLTGGTDGRRSLLLLGRRHAEMLGACVACPMQSPCIAMARDHCLDGLSNDVESLQPVTGTER
jgi:hypothetical protein